MSYSGFTDRSGPGGVVHNPASAYAREMAKFEMGYSPYGPPGRPREVVGYQEYPARFYKVTRSDKTGKIVVEHEQNAADETEALNLKSRGYVQGLGEAYKALEAAEQTLAVEAAIHERQKLTMSQKARDEAAAYEATTAKHVAEIPEASKRHKA